MQPLDKACLIKRLAGFQGRRLLCVYHRSHQSLRLKDNMGWSGWEEFRNLTPNDKTNLQQQR
jgi:hypothetical protein